MDVRPPPNTPPVSRNIGESSSDGVFLSAANHPFWEQGSVPDPDSDEFQAWISGKSEDIKKPTVPIFVPKDQHCGIWHSPPNKSCSSSFGDQGTTASTNCFGDIIQMTQYLGAGRSGLFSMDQKLTDEPYLVHGRAQDLENLAKDTGDLPFTFDLSIPAKFFPQEPLNVKWVNWRWPRYEYDTGVPQVKAFMQWVVRDGIVLKQFVLENASHEDVEFNFQFSNDMWIRDLDFLDKSYGFNDSDKDYSHVPGPNGFGYICIHTLEPTATVNTSGDERMPLDVPQPGSLRNAAGDSGRGPAKDPEPTPASDSQLVQPDSDIAGQTFEPSKNTQPSSPVTTEQETNKAEDRKETGPQTNSSHAVASVITIFVNGKAIKTQGGSDYAESFTVAAKASNSAEPHGTMLEVVVAYKMILLPDAPVDWRNFLVPARKADVNDILQRETERLWEASESSSLVSIGLSLMEVNPDMRNMAPNVSNTRSTNNSPNEWKEQGPKDNNPNADSEPPNENETTTTNGGNSRRPHDWETPSTPKTKITETPTGVPGKASSRNHIEYLVWRHLEHILSVCAVPLSIPALFEGAGKPHSNPATLSSLAVGVPVVLTCGDMAGHRISTSASFFAFKFLVDVARRLKSCGTDSLYICDLQRRIKSVCQDHIKWLKLLRSHLPMDQPESRNRLLESGCFAANYWVTGFIMPQDTNTWQPNDTVTDTPFHILKIVEYLHICNMDEDQEIRELLRDIWIPWLLELDKTDRRSSYAWPHAFHEDINTFRLDDHVWVWRALKSLEDLDFWKFLPALKSIREGKATWKTSDYDWIKRVCGPEDDDLNEEEAFVRFEKVAKRLLPVDVQKNSLQRFTTENDLDVSRKRMLAVTRSPRETRFLLHSRDTSLFYGEDLGFFPPDSPYHELWKNTLEAQLHHDENKETSWDNAIRYALGIVVGTRDWSLNNKAPTELVRTCADTLIRSSSHTGFIPGQLDEVTKEPRLFYDEEDANFYYHASFEINHVLLTHAKRIDQAFQKVAEYTPRRLRTARTMPPPMDRDSTIRSALDEILKALTTQPKRQRNEQGQQSPGLSLSQLGVATGLDTRRSLTMKKLIPFNNLIDVSSINALDEEWLYNYPQFFTMGEINLEEYVDMPLTSVQPSRDSVGGIIGQELELHRSARHQKKHRSLSTSQDTVSFIAEKPKQKHLGKREKRHWREGYSELLTNNELWSKLRVPRTARKAKKRFLSMRSANSETAFLCWLASPEAEKTDMSLFFDRHSKYEKHFWDDTTMVVNTWQTELHISFYTLVDAAHPLTLGLPSLSTDPFPGGSKKELRRASIGFRFDGDFFDRYWTCHYIQYIHQDLPIERISLDPIFQFSEGQEGKKWWQRKFLELHLLYRILVFATESSLRILEQIRSELGIGDSTLSFSILDSDAYFSAQENWQRFEYILQAVDEDLSAVLRTLEKWHRREAERGQEQPRWTRSDERQYRGAISKLQGATEREMRDLEGHRNNIRKLKETLTASREKIRDERELHRNENIRYFTYVTVIFLPLGFAASFYSMNGAPQHDLMISLVQFAVAAFAVTVGLLASAKVIFGVVDIILLPLQSLRKQAELELEKYSRDKREKSLLYGDREERPHHVDNAAEEERTAPTPTPRTENQGPKPSESTEDQGRVPRPGWSAQDVSTSSSWLWFWLSYIFFEVPGLRFLAAINIVENKRLSPRGAAEVVLGILFLPIFGLAWVSKFVFLNLQDFIRLLNHVWQVVTAGSNATAAPIDNADEALRRRFAQMTRAPDSLRPFKGMEKRLEGRSRTTLQQPPTSAFGGPLQPSLNPADGTAKESNDASTGYD